jgi:hypothetical protein
MGGLSKSPRHGVGAYTLSKQENKTFYGVCPGGGGWCSKMKKSGILVLTDFYEKFNVECRFGEL